MLLKSGGRNNFFSSSFSAAASGIERYNDEILECSLASEIVPLDESQEGNFAIGGPS